MPEFYVDLTNVDMTGWILKKKSENVLTDFYRIEPLSELIDHVSNLVLKDLLFNP